MSLISSVTLREGDKEPVVNTVVAFLALDWGVAFRRCSDGLWYPAGRGCDGHTWSYLLEMVDGEDVFLIGPEHQPGLTRSCS